jgi:hypothetical protein
VNLTTISKLLPNRRSAELFQVAFQRQQVLGRSWLTEIGHKRPDTPKGLPLAEAQKQAAELGERIRKLAAPVTVTLSLKPVEE